MNTLPEAEELSPIDAFGCELLRSYREGFGNWRFYFAGAELTAWGRVSLMRQGATFEDDDPFFYSVLNAFRDCELLHAELAENVLVLDFYGDTITISSDDDGELVSLLRDGDLVADVWTLQDGTLTHSTREREPFDSLLS
jgi:hypothetical protein